MPTRFNPAPGWPPAPAGWTPPPGWQPDPAWPPAPPGWQLWVEEPAAPASADSRWTFGGGAAVVLGSLLPWVSVRSSDLAGLSINGGARGASAVFGLVLIGLGAAILSRTARGAKTQGYAITLLVLSILGALGYGLFAIAGFAGFSETDELGDTVRVTFSPSVGLIMMFLGCAAVVFGAIRALAHKNQRPRG